MLVCTNTPVGIALHTSQLQSSMVEQHLCPEHSACLLVRCCSLRQITPWHARLSNLHKTAVRLFCTAALSSGGLLLPWEKKLLHLNFAHYASCNLVTSARRLLAHVAAQGNAQAQAGHAKRQHSQQHVLHSNAAKCTQGCSLSFLIRIGMEDYQLCNQTCEPYTKLYDSSL